MIKAVARMKDGRPMLILGLTSENFTRMLAKEPLQVDVGLLGEDMPELVIVMVAGRTEADITRDLAPMFGPDTKMHGMSDG